MKTNEPKLKTTKEPKFVTRGEAAEMLGVDRQTIANLVARKILHSGGNIVSKTGKNATTIIRTKELFDMLNKMGDLADVDQSLKNLELLKVELAQKEKEYKEHIESLEERIDYGNVNYVLDMFRLSSNKLFVKILDNYLDITEHQKKIFKQFAEGSRVESIARWNNITIVRVWEIIRKVIRAIVARIEEYDAVVEERDNYKFLIEKQAEEIRALRSMVPEKDNKIIEPAIDEKMKVIVDMQNKLNMRLCDVQDIPVRCHRLSSGWDDVDTLGKLVQLQKHDIFKFRNIGKKTIYELETAIKKMGLDFGMDVSQYGIEKFALSR